MYGIYLPTSTIKFHQMYVNIPYADPVVMVDHPRYNSYCPLVTGATSSGSNLHAGWDFSTRNESMYLLSKMALFHCYVSLAASTSWFHSTLLNLQSTYSV